MKLYSSNKSYKLYYGNSLDMLEVIEPKSIDAIITDPPYELNFMGKSWDKSGIAFNTDIWKKCFEVLKPGAYLLAFGGSRTFHRIACAIEDAGFEIRDCIMWLYGSGFPKSFNIGLAIDKKNGVESKVIGSNKSGVSLRAYQSEATTTAGEYEIKEAQNEWSGWGTALKPAYEPIIVARKPIEKSVVDNVLKYGVGGINIDECRVDVEKRTIPINSNEIKKDDSIFTELHKNIQKERVETNVGRFPSNVIHDGSEEACAGMPTGSVTGHRTQTSINNCIESRKNKKGNSQCDVGGNIDHITEYTDSGSVSRYFYCAKASKKDRDEGLNRFDKINGGSYQFRQDGSLDGKIPVRKNIHPTVKPVELMQYLVRLVSPKGATILDLFNGSGSTGKAVMYENRERDANYKYIGIELTEEYLPISKARIDEAITQELEKEIILNEKETAIQLNIFDFIKEC